MNTEGISGAVLVTFPADSMGFLIFMAWRQGGGCDVRCGEQAFQRLHSAS